MEAEQETIAKVKATIINNTEKELQNAIVIGRINDENKQISLKLASAIDMQNAQVYYTKDENVKIDSTWEAEYSEDATGYKIELPKIEKATVINFEYDLKIPATLESEKELKLGYTLYNEESQIKSPTIVLQTEKELEGEGRIYKSR